MLQNTGIELVDEWYKFNSATCMYWPMVRKYEYQPTFEFVSTISYNSIIMRAPE